MKLCPKCNYHAWRESVETETKTCAYCDIQDQRNDLREDVANLKQGLGQLKETLFGNIQCINFMHERRHACFQSQAAYDGSISDECRDAFKKEYELWDSLIEERKALPTAEAG